MTEKGQESDVFRRTMAIPEVKFARTLFGTYDIIAKLEGADAMDIYKEKIYAMEGVKCSKVLEGISGF